MFAELLYLIFLYVLLSPEGNSWNNTIAVVQSLSHVQLFATPWTAARQASLSTSVCWCLLKLISIKSVMPSKHLILCHPLLLLSSIFPNIRVFSSESTLCIRWLKFWSFSFNRSPSNEYLVFQHPHSQDVPGNSIGVGWHFILQGIFLITESPCFNPHSFLYPYNQYLLSTCLWETEHLQKLILPPVSKSYHFHEYQGLGF